MEYNRGQCVPPDATRSVQRSTKCKRHRQDSQLSLQWTWWGRRLCPARALARRFAIAFGDLPSASLRRISFRPPKSIRWSPVGFMMSEHWPRGTLVTRLYERDSLALSLIRSSGETRAHRSPSARTTLAPPSERPNGRWISAILTVRRLLYSNGFLPPFSSAEFCSAYQTLAHSGPSSFHPPPPLCRMPGLKRGLGDCGASGRRLRS